MLIKLLEHFSNFLLSIIKFMTKIAENDISEFGHGTCCTLIIFNLQWSQVEEVFVLFGLVWLFVLLMFSVKCFPSFQFFY